MNKISFGTFPGISPNPGLLHSGLLNYDIPTLRPRVGQIRQAEPPAQLTGASGAFHLLKALRAIARGKDEAVSGFGWCDGPDRENHQHQSA